MAISGAASKVAKKFQNSKTNQKLTKKLDDITSSLKSKTKNITANIAKKTKEVTQKAVNTVSDKAKTIANKTLNISGKNKPGINIKKETLKDPYEILKKNGINPTLNEFEREALDAGNWKMHYSGDSFDIPSIVSKEIKETNIRENILKNINESRLARQASRFNDYGVVKTRVLSREETIATIKSTRRQVEKLMKNDLIAQNYIRLGLYDQYGTYFHNRVFKRVRSVNIQGLVIDKNIIRPGTVGGKGNIRRPDFQWQVGTLNYEIWDLKPNGFLWSKQFDNIKDWTGVVPKALKYNK